MKITFASGKGGTGKTTIAVNFAFNLSTSGKKVQYLDCDVEEPNGHLFLQPRFEKKTPVRIMVPLVDNDKCIHCGKCGNECRFNAIVNLKDKVMIFPDLCHGCALCVKVCPVKAIKEEERETGFIEEGVSGIDAGLKFTQGVLNVGEPMAGPVITDVKKYYKDDHVLVIDAPPGTSCPVVKTVADADVIVFVTEPTPFGLHDLKIAVTVAEKMGKPYGVVINRYSEFKPLNDFLEQNNIPILMSLPENQDIARAYSRGEIVLRSLPEYSRNFDILTENVMKLAVPGN